MNLNFQERRRRKYIYGYSETISFMLCFCLLGNENFPRRATESSYHFDGNCHWKLCPKLFWDRLFVSPFCIAESSKNHRLIRRMSCGFVRRFRLAAIRIILRYIYEGRMSRKRPQSSWQMSEKVESDKNIFVSFRVRASKKFVARFLCVTVVSRNTYRLQPTRSREISAFHFVLLNW